MTTPDDPHDPNTGRDDHDQPGTRLSVECLLFDSLIHHMIEKGLLTKNDALSIIQTVAQIMRVYVEEDDPSTSARSTLSMLERIYASFEAVPGRSLTAQSDAGNVRQLRPPLHGDRLKFPDTEET
jgi:hypothetical protein